MTTLYCAKWVLPVIAAPIDDGAVAVEGDSFVAVGTRADLIVKFPAAQVCSFGEAAILPGLINCHSHLELTALRGYLEREENEFFSWLRKLTLARLERLTPDDLYVSALWGAVEAARAGVTCLADASSEAGASMAALRDVGLRGTVYQEVFGPDPAFASEQFTKLREKITLLRRASETSLVRVGVSPHAPYTVSAPLLEAVAEYALAESLPVMMHAAESVAETLFMREGRGPFAESLARRGIAWRAPAISTIAYLASLGVLRARPLLAHCITADAADLAILLEAQASVAHCPKSNAKLGHGRAPFAAFVESGLAVGFGSDSVASNNTCDILEEARFATLLARSGGDRFETGINLDAQRALHIATCGGARALRLEGQTGALASGLQADFTIIRLDGAHQLPVHDPAAALIFASSGRDVVLTVVAGKEIYRDGRIQTIDESALRARLNEIKLKLG